MRGAGPGFLGRRLPRSRCGRRGWQREEALLHGRIEALASCFARLRLVMAHQDLEQLEQLERLQVAILSGTSGRSLRSGLRCSTRRCSPTNSSRSSRWRASSVCRGTTLH